MKGSTLMTYRKLARNKQRFVAMTGLTLKEFEALLPSFRTAFAQYVKHYRLDGQPRGKRTYRDYKNSPLPTIEDKLLFILVYLKQAPTQQMQASAFGMYQAEANLWLLLLHTLLKQALAALTVLPARHDPAGLGDQLSPGVYFHDGTERAIVRPSDPVEQQLYYSGKKKQHTLKNILIIDPTCRVIWLSPTCEGKKHDKKAADEAGYRLPAGSILVQDTGFQGFSLVGVTILQPKKKPKGRELTVEEKESNRLISQLRVRMEHAIGGVKRSRIVKDEIRNWKAGFRDQVMETCCGLHNFRLDFRPWHYAPLEI
jgi:hypothetical protein